MAKTRLELHEMLCNLLGSRNVYYRPPESIKMQYPAIVYDRTQFKNTYADNGTYMKDKAYSLTVIYKNADSDLPDRIAMLPFCRFDRSYVADNLNHDIFTIYY